MIEITVGLESDFGRLRPRRIRIRKGPQVLPDIPVEPGSFEDRDAAEERGKMLALKAIQDLGWNEPATEIAWKFPLLGSGEIGP